MTTIYYHQTKTTNMKEKRNSIMESDGLFWESETHEWFNDTIATEYAQKITYWADKQGKDNSLAVMAFVVRNKENGEYERVLVDKVSNKVIHSAQSIEAMGTYIDLLKLNKIFDK